MAEKLFGGDIEISFTEEVINTLTTDHDYLAVTAVSEGSSETPTGLKGGSSLPVLVNKSNSTSVIWDFFGSEADKNGYAIDNGRPQCCTCFKEVASKAGNTTNLFKHPKDHHPAVCQI